MFPLGFHELVLAVVHDPADRGVGGGGHLNHIKAFGLSDPDGLMRGHDTQLGSILVDDSDLRGADAIVDSRLVSSDTFLPINARKVMLSVIS